MAEIKTKRLLLRPMRLTDADDLFAVFGDPRVMKYWSTPPHPDVKHTAALIRETIEADPVTTAEFAIESEGRVIGKAGFWRMPEIGYLLHPDHWRGGFGYEALEALIIYGFADRGLEQITADIDPDNAASIGLLSKLGFVETGREKNTVEVTGVWYDSVYYTLTNANWQEGASK